VFCEQVAEEDLKRVAAATGGVVQSTVNNLDPKVLGTCANFEEVQVTILLLPFNTWTVLWA
jgi:T-complex protein 1 subunit eta